MWPSPPPPCCCMAVSMSLADMADPLLGRRRSAALWMGTGWLWPFVAADDEPAVPFVADAVWWWPWDPRLAVKRCFLRRWEVICVSRSVVHGEKQVGEARW